MTLLPRVRPGLLRHHLDDQVVVYDPREDRVHLLDPTTASVLELLEEGIHEPREIAAELTRRFGITPDSDIVALAMDELYKADLIDGHPETSSVSLDVTRRDVMRRLVAAGAAAFVIPAVVSITASPAAGQSGGAGNIGAACLPGSVCNAGARCCANVCVAGACGAIGSCCTNTSDCCTQGPGHNCSGNPKVCT